MKGSFTAAITVDIPNVAFDGAFKVDFDTTGTTPTFAVASTGTVTLTIAGQTLSATSITLSKNAQGVDVAVTGLGVRLGTFVNITGLAGSLQITSAGIAARVP